MSALHGISSLFGLLCFDEGVEPRPYQDTRGYWTVGIGHNIDANGIPAWLAFELGMGWESYSHANTDQLVAALKSSPLSNSQIDRLYQSDLDTIMPVLSMYDVAGPVRFAALGDMMFNLGISTFQTFTDFLSFVRAGEWARAAQALRGTLVYRQLTSRYERLARMLETGDWP